MKTEQIKKHELSDQEQIDYIRYIAKTYCGSSVSEAVKFIINYSVRNNKNETSESIY